MSRSSPSRARASRARAPRALACVLGLSLAFGSTVAPVPASAQVFGQTQGRPSEQPGGDNTAAVLAALLAFGIIGAIIDDDDDDDDGDRDRRDREDRDGRAEIGGRGGPDGRGRELSADCVRHVGGGQRVLTRACLKDRGFRGRLPDGCRADLDDRGRRHAVYDLRCLRDAGYDLR